MKLLRISVWMVVAVLTLFGGFSCSDDEGIDNRETDYGYVQFKLYKEASYSAQSRAVTSQLDYLAQACKVKVTLYYNETTIAQSLTLSAADAESAEYGLRSEKLKLLAGDYKIVTFSLYDSDDEVIYNGSPVVTDFTIVAGGLTVQDVTVNVTPRGKVRFTLCKELLSDGQADMSGTRAAERSYTFDEISTVDLTVQNLSTNERVTFDRLPATFSVHYSDKEQSSGNMTSSILCDTLLSLRGGDYRVASYRTYDSNKMLIESNSHPKESRFTVVDNETCEADVVIQLNESEEYIQDYYALYAIWKALDGEHWYYIGENYPEGVNWQFENRDIDLWGDQPGVQLHSNGRVAFIDISNFGFKGAIPSQIGQLTELVSLYLGTHNDTNLLNYDPTLDSKSSLSRKQRHSAYLDMIHPVTQLSEPIARALMENNISIPEISMYESLSENQIIDPTSGRQYVPRRFDTVHGKICNGLTGIDPAIGNCVKLETLCIANSTITHLPDTFENLVSCTDFEIYNCPLMTEFPMCITRMPSLISVNLSNNGQWSEEVSLEGFKRLATGASSKSLQILYYRENNLPEFPAEVRQMEKIGMLDLSVNRISKVVAPGKSIAFTKLYLDNNLIESIPVNEEDGAFCDFADVENFSVSHNLLTKVPNIFSATSKYTMGSVDFSNNLITGCEGEENGTYKGMRVETLTMNDNKTLTTFPSALITSGSVIYNYNLRGCSIASFPDDVLSHKNSNASEINSFDLSYNKLTKLPKDFSAYSMPYFYGLDVSYNCFSEFPYEPLYCPYLTVYAIRGQRDAEGNRSLQEWPQGLYQHKGLRGFYIGSNDLRRIEDTISTLIYYLDISDNPNITFDASDICYAYQVGAYVLIYDKTQNILNCDYMLE